MSFHGPARANDQITWRVWGPYANDLQLNLLAPNCRQVFKMNHAPNGWFEITLPICAEGVRYAFQLDGNRLRPDPASRWQPEGVHKPSALFFASDFAWSDSNWKGVARSNLVFYEIHVGTFTAARTFDAVIPRLPELRSLGITAIELMPISQFPGSRNWGYDGVHPFAVQNSYGGPLALQRLVDACHRHGIAIFLDVVYNHLGPEGNYLAEFGPYFSDRHRTPWGMALNYADGGCEAVRQLILDNVRYWLRDFHLDGLRLDAVQEIYDDSEVHILQEIQDLAEYESLRQEREIHIVAETSLNDVRLVDSADRQGYGLAAQWNDDFHHSIHTLLTGEQNGYYGDFGSPEQLVKVLNHNHAYDGCHSRFHGRQHGASARHLAQDRFVVCVQNHDQIGNRAIGDRLAGLLTPEQQRLAAGVLLLSPFLPLLFMGEEYGDQSPFPFFCSFNDPELIEAVRSGRRSEFAEFLWTGTLPDPQAETTFSAATLRWNWHESWRCGLRNWYRALLHLRSELRLRRATARPVALWHDRQESNESLETRSGGVSQNADPGDRSATVNERQHGILELIHGDESLGKDSQVVAYFNFSSRSQNLSRTFVALEGWVERQILISSEWPQFGGSHLDEKAHSSTSKGVLLPYEVVVYSSVNSKHSVPIIREKAGANECTD